MKYPALLEILTMEDAINYSKETDKLVWIEYNLLDPNNLPRSLAEDFEEALIAILNSKV